MDFVHQTSSLAKEKEELAAFSAAAAGPIIASVAWQSKKAAKRLTRYNMCYQEENTVYHMLHTLLWIIIKSELF